MAREVYVDKQEGKDSVVPSVGTGSRGAWGNLPTNPRFYKNRALGFGGQMW